MTENARAVAAALNREIVDDQPGRLTIHTHSIRLTQANLPYQAVQDKRLASQKDFVGDGCSGFHFDDPGMVLEGFANVARVRRFCAKRCLRENGGIGRHQPI